MPDSPLLPGATIGILGSGQLGRMLAMAARHMGYEIAVYSPESNPPAAPVSNRCFTASYKDAGALAEFARSVDVVTFEFENVPADSIQQLSQSIPVRPSPAILHLSQNRLREKSWFQTNGYPVPEFRSVQNMEDLKKAVETIGCPGVLKTAELGYDGKGQTKIESKADLEWMEALFDGQSWIYEAFVPFAKEISVIGARNPSGESVLYPVFENVHRNHILDTTIAPADIAEDLARAAGNWVLQFMEDCRLEGLIAIEMFVTQDAKILINEIAPRTHNSGHLTLDACVTSQFEQQIRAISDLPLGDAGLLRPAAMANLLGHLWEDGVPDWRQALRDPMARLHLYGKKHAKPGRKMGHVTVLDESTEAALRRVEDIRDKLNA